jgi:ABC-2 type transport system permease protein
MSAIYILWLRQIKRYWRSKGRMAGMLGQPLLFLFALGLGLGPIFEKAGAGDYIQFLAPGVIAMTILFSGMFSGIDVIWERQIGFLKETLVAPVRRSSIMIGKTLGGATISVFQGIIIFLMSLIAGFSPNIAYLPLALLFMILISILFTAFGVALASRLEDMQAFPIIINFVIMPIFFISGALFPLDEVPKFLKIIAQFNPLTYGVDGIRGALTASHHFPLLLDFSIVLVLAVIMMAIGSYLFSKVQA